MKTADLVFAQGPAYPFLRQDTGELVCNVQDGIAGGRWLERFCIAPQGKSATFSVYEERNGIICAASERQVFRDQPDAGWTLFSQQEYSGDAKYLPAEISEGDSGRYQTQGSWTWNDRDGNTDHGTWQYDVRYCCLFGRLFVLETYREVNSNGGIANFDREEVYVLGQPGLAGFDDELVTGWNGVVCRPEWRKP